MEINGKSKRRHSSFFHYVLVGCGAVWLLQYQEPAQVKKKGLYWSEPVPLDMSIFHGSYMARVAAR